MAVPKSTLVALDYSYGGLPFVNIEARPLSTSTLDYSFDGLPFYGATDSAVTSDLVGVTASIGLGNLILDPRAFTLSSDALSIGQGTLVPSIVIAGSGESLTTYTGIITPTGGQVAIILSGEALATVSGNVSVDFTRALTGRSVTISRGSFTLEKSIALIGDSITVYDDAVVVFTYLGTSQQLSGVLVTTELTSLTLSGRVLPLSGFEITTSQQSITARSSFTLTGHQQTLSQESIALSRNKGLVGAELIAQQESLIFGITRPAVGFELVASEGSISGVERSNELFGHEAIIFTGITFRVIEFDSVDWVIYEQKAKDVLVAGTISRCMAAVNRPKIVVVASADDSVFTNK